MLPKIIKTIGIYLPLLLITYSFILTIFQRNISLVYLQELTPPLVIATMATILLTFISQKIWRDETKGNIFTSVFILLFFLYGDAWWNINSQIFTFRGNNFSVNYLLLPIFALFLAITILILKKTSLQSSAINKYLLIVAILINIYPSYEIISYELSLAKVSRIANFPKIYSNDKTATSSPDIYYIMPEDYSGFEVLKNEFKYDSTKFTADLEKEGFYVTTQSSSNYPKTFLSLTSSLNLQYLDNLSVLKNSSDQNIVNNLINNNIVYAFLKERDYKIYQMGSWWGSTKNNPYADENLILDNKSNLSVSGFNYVLLSSSVLNPLIDVISTNGILTESDSDKRKRTEFQFQNITNIIGRPSPKFVFIHIMSPHEPYVYDQNCNFIDRSKTDKKSEEENYVNQISCLNQKIMDSVKLIKSKSTNPPIIILQSDEGASFFADKLTPRDSWEHANAKLLQNKFPIFSAFYLPNINSDDLYPQISPVNTFRYIFQKYFFTNTPLLEDRNYIFPSLSNLYEFKDVTTIIRE